MVTGVNKHSFKHSFTRQWVNVVSQHEESVLVCIKSMHVLSSSGQDYCVYRDIWKPSAGEKLVVQREFDIISSTNLLLNY